MSSNAWVESYLDLLLSRGSIVHAAPGAGGYRPIGGLDGPTAAETQAASEVALYKNFYVQQVLSMPEDDIAEAWARANVRSAPSRLRYNLWRVWFIKRKQLEIAAEESRREIETEASDGMSLSLGLDTEDEEPGSARDYYSTPPPSPGHSSPDLSPTLPTLSEGFASGQAPLFVVLISLHGLVRANEIELGRDSDTGGQVKYVVELAQALSRHPGVHRVSLLTRRITDSSVDASYGVPEERITPEAGAADAGAFIVRLDAGSSDVYLRKELLWPHIREFADRALQHISATRRALEEAYGRSFRLVAIHGHYADASEIATMIGATLSCPVVVTGHSLGRNKLASILSAGKLTRSEVEEQYRIGRRIEAEERALDHAEAVVVSTQAEIDVQWSAYSGFDKSLSAVLSRSRRFTGRAMPKMIVIPPGLDFSQVTPLDPDAPLPSAEEEPEIWGEISRWLRHSAKAAILVLARPDPKKNLVQLLRSYGENALLRELANLVMFLGTREDIRAMSSAAQDTMMELFAVTDELDLWGSVAFPKHHLQSQKSDIFSFAAARRGVFANVALNEPFGLVFIEAAAHGLPFIATEHGGPVEINATLQCGILVDPMSSASIQDALVRLLTDRELYMSARRNALERIGLYSWDSHVRKYMVVVDELDQARKKSAIPDLLPLAPPSATAPRALLCVLLDSRDARQSAELLNSVESVLERHSDVACVVNSVLNLEETIRIIQQAGFDTGRLAAVIADAGALIAKPSADGSFRPSDAWGSLIAFRWLRPVATCGVLDASLGALALLPSPALPSPILRFQLAEGATAVPAIHLLMRRLRRKGIRLTLHYAAGAYELRALPLRASRSLALRWLASRLGVSLDSTVILASNTSEPDGDRADAMAGITRVVLVGGEPPIPEVIGPSVAAAVAAAFVQRTVFVKEAALADALTVALQSPAPAEDQK